MGISLKPRHVKRYKDIAWLLARHGRSDWVRQIGMDDSATDAMVSANRDTAKAAEQLAADLEKMGPTFIKLGQLLSSRADLLPPTYLGALARLQDNVEPFGFDQVEATISSELGVRFSRAFADFDPRPLAAASLGQVHLARLRDGRRVVVKVQRPGIKERIVADLDALAEVAGFLEVHSDTARRYRPTRQLAELRKALLAELDYRQEADNLDALAENLKENPRIVVPRPIHDYTSTRVLTMDHITGSKITSLSPVVLNEIDKRCLLEALFSAYLKQILVDGFFHADPHPGNIYLTDDHRIALLDLGMVARCSPGFQHDFLKLLLAVSDGRGEDAADIALAMGERGPDVDRAEFRRQTADFVARHQNVRLSKIQTGRVVLEIQRIAAACDVLLPDAFTMIGKTLLNLDRIGQVLDADFDPNAAIKRNATAILRQRMLRGLSVGNLFNVLLDTTDFIQRLPGRLSAVLEVLSERDMKLKVDAIDEEYLLKGMHKVANRITAGLVLAALIIGAALLMRVETSFTILGYPGFAILLFAAAAAGGFLLVARIFIQDHRHENEITEHGRKRRI